MSLLKQILLCTALVFAVLILEIYVPFDFLVQDRLYNYETHQWPITAEMHHKYLTYFFYTGYKVALSFFALGCKIVFISSFFIDKLKKYRKPCIMLVLCIIFVPSYVAGAKQWTNVYCPYQLERYGSIEPYVPVLKSYPQGYVQEHKGKCFPAGHSTGGFALMGLYFFFRNRKYKRMGLATGITLGWITGMYQTLRGEHFVSHTIIAMLASWVVILIVNQLVELFARRYNKKHPT